MPAGITRDTEISRNFDLLDVDVYALSDLLITVYFMKILIWQLDSLGIEKLQ